MEFRVKQHKRLRNALTAAYLEKEKTEVSDLWQSKTMRHIRSLGPLNSKAGYLISFEQLLWRLAPFACALIIIFSLCLFNIDWMQEYEVAKLFLDDPVEYAFMQSFGM